MRISWLTVILSISKHIAQAKKSLLGFGVLKSVVCLLYILLLEIVLGILSLPLYLGQGYIENPALFNQ